MDRNIIGGKDILKAINKALNIQDSLAIVAIPKIGVKTALNYSENHFLTKFNNVLFDKEAVITSKEIEKWINSKNNNEMLLIVLPYLHQKSDEEISEVNRIANRVDKDRLVFITHLRPSQLEMLKSKTTNTKLFSNVYKALPLNRDRTFELIESYLMQSGSEMPEDLKEKIYEYSGGIIGLVKRLVNYYIYYEKEDITKDIISYESLSINLSSISSEIEKINDRILEEYGILKDGKHVSKLVKYFEEEKNNTKSLSKTEEQILLILKANLGKIVSIEDISDKLGTDFSLWGSYKKISRLRSKIKNKYKIQNVKGKGYRLVKI